MSNCPAVRIVPVVAALVLLVSACATQAPAATADGGQLVCRQEVRTGSLRPTTSCRTAEDIRRDEEEANRTLGGPRPTTSGATATGR